MESGKTSAIIGRVVEAHELVERLRTEVFGERRKENDEKVGPEVALLFSRHPDGRLLMGMFYMNWQTDNRLAMAKRTGTWTSATVAMFELARWAPKNPDQVAVSEASGSTLGG